MSTAASSSVRPPKPRRGRRIALISAAVVVVLALLGALLVWFVPVLQVRNVEISGNDHIASEEIREATGVADGENLVRVDLSAAAAGVVGLPWVNSATVNRSLPDTLVVEVDERDAVAYTDSEGQPTLIDSTGEPFTTAEPPEEAIHISGEAAEDEQALTGAVEVAAAVPPHIRSQVATLEAEDPYSYTFVLHDGRRVFWGANQDNANKALAMETVLQREGGEWNISDPTMVTVR